MVPIIRPIATTAYLLSSLQCTIPTTRLFFRPPLSTTSVTTITTTCRKRRSFTAVASLIVTTATLTRSKGSSSSLTTTRIDAHKSPPPISTTTNTIMKMSAAASSSSVATGTNDNGTTGTGTTTTPKIKTGYLNVVDAAALDEELMSTPGFTLEQLMELAGLAVAEAVYQVIPPPVVTQLQPPVVESNDSGTLPMIMMKGNRRTGVLIICGPGNNGGDGLVAARHLYMFGYTDIVIVYPALHKVKHVHYKNLIQQCQDLGIPITDAMPDQWSSNFSIVVDAMFGFSFCGEPRPPYDDILDQLKSVNNNDNITSFAVDIPSGWNVDGVENLDYDLENRFIPDVLISLTAPKICAQQYTGRHFVGGRFLPLALAQKYNISMPPYPGVAQVMEITSFNDTENPTIAEPTMNVDRSWEVQYTNYLAEKEMAEQKSTSTTPQSQHPKQEEEEITWEAQYAAYCAEKEAKLQLLDEEERRNTKDESLR